MLLLDKGATLSIIFLTSLQFLSNVINQQVKVSNTKPANGACGSLGVSII